MFARVLRHAVATRPSQTVAAARFCVAARLLHGSPLRWQQQQQQQRPRDLSPPVAGVPAAAPTLSRAGQTAPEVDQDLELDSSDSAVSATVLGKFKDWLLRQLLERPPGLHRGSWETPAAAVEATLPHLFAQDNTAQGNHTKIAQLTSLLYNRVRPTADDIIVFNKIIHCYERLGRLDMCEEWIRRMEAEGTHPIRVTYNCLIKAARSDPARGEYWFHQMRANNFEPNIQTFNKLIENFSEARDRNGAMRWFEAAEAHPKIHLDEVMYNTVLKVFAGHPDEAEQWVEKMISKGLQPTLYTYNKLIDIFAQAGLYKRVEAKVDEMHRKGILPDVFTYNSAINANHANPEGAARWFERLIAGNIRPNEITFTWLVKACVHSRRYDLAASWLRRMEEEMVVANAEFCRNAFYIYLRANIHGDAEMWLDRYLAQSSAAAGSLALSLLQAFAAVGNAPRAVHWFHFLEERGAPTPSIEALNAVIEAHCRSGKFAEARGWLASIPARGLTANAQSYNPFIEAAAQEPSSANAERLFSRLVADNIAPDFWSYQYLLEAYSVGNEGKAALECFERMEAAGFRPTEHTFCAVLRACRTDPVNAGLVLERMVKAEIRPSMSTVNLIIDVYAQAGDSARAEQYFNEAVAAGLVPDSFTYGILIHANAGKPERAASWFHRMRQNGVSPNVVTYSSMIKAYATMASSASPAETVRLVAAAEEWLEQMLADGIAPSLHTFTTLISLYARVGRPDKAASTFVRLIDAGLQPNVFTYTALIGSFSNTGELDFATKVFQRMIQRGVEPNEKTYQRLLRTCLSADKPEQVVEWLQDMEARRVPRTNATTVMAIRTASLLRKRNQFDQAALLKPFMTPTILLENSPSSSGPAAPAPVLSGLPNANHGRDSRPVASGAGNSRPPRKFAHASRPAAF